VFVISTLTIVCTTGRPAGWPHALDALSNERLFVSRPDRG
jgi:hypothetical protein